MSRYKSGVLFTIIGALFWGLSGTCGQFLLQFRGVTSGWLVSVRMLSAGMILLLLCYKKEGKAIFRVWKETKDRLDLFVFAAFGLAFCQFTYFSTITYSNAGTATVLQFLAPVLIMAYLSVKNRKMPRAMERLAICFAVAGIFLLATHGQFDSLAISKNALIFGLLSALSVVIYNLQPARLIKTYGTLLALGWGMLIGGILLSFLYQPWQVIGIGICRRCFLWRRSLSWGRSYPSAVTWKASTASVRQPEVSCHRLSRYRQRSCRLCG